MVTLDVVALLGVVLFLFGFHRLGTAIPMYQGTHVITCPETAQTVALKLGAWQAATTAVFRKPVLRVRECSQWPEHANCKQACVQVIGRAPEESEISSILARWCQDKSCVCCGAHLGEMPLRRHPPGLMDPDRRVVEWSDVPPQELPRMLGNCGPVCWTCLTAETHTW